MGREGSKIMGRGPKVKTKAVKKTKLGEARARKNARLQKAKRAKEAKK